MFSLLRSVDRSKFSQGLMNIAVIMCITRLDHFVATSDSFSSVIRVRICNSDSLGFCLYMHLCPW